VETEGKFGRQHITCTITNDSVVNGFSAAALTVAEWIAATAKARKPDPPKPEELLKEEGLRSDAVQYTEFADRMIRAVYGKNRYSHNSSVALFDDLVSPSLEAFALLLYKNGYENWVWMHNNACLTSDVSDDTEEECPNYKYTTRTGGDFTNRNGGWSRDGMSLYNKLYNMAKTDRETNNGSFGKLYKSHRVEMCGRKRKRKTNDGGLGEQLTICDDLDDLWALVGNATEEV
jgi:hypothetical protein